MYLMNEDEYIAAQPRILHSTARPHLRRKARKLPVEPTNWKLILAYDGAEFHGWQVQRAGTAAAAISTGKVLTSTTRMPTIQGALAAAIFRVVGERVLPQGAGRTDAGVHAEGQVASFLLSTPIPAANLQYALNRVLPPAIRVLSAESAPPGFHARYSSIGKIYRYRIFDGAVCSPFVARYVSRSRWPLDRDAMQQAARAVLGQHDFTSFAASDPDRTARRERQAAREMNAGANTAANTAAESGHPSNLRRIDQSDWESSAETDSPARIFTYTVRGNGFLHHMVRNLVGTFIEIGRGRMEPAAMAEILAERQRALAGPTAPARGLCLVRVLY